MIDPESGTTVTVGLSLVTKSPDVSNTSPSRGVVPVASAEFVTLPASMSACVKIYCAVTVALSPGASVVTVRGAGTGAVPVPVNGFKRVPGSATPTFVSVTLPLFATIYL